MPSDPVAVGRRRGNSTPVGPPRPARPSRRSVCHRAPCGWRPGCSCPMIT